MLIILWVVAAILTLSGILALFRKEYKWGIIFIIVACIVGPLLTNFFGGPPAGPRSTSETSPSSAAATGEVVAMRTSPTIPVGLDQLH